jgi:hypothetical protein
LLQNNELERAAAAVKDLGEAPVTRIPTSAVKKFITDSAKGKTGQALDLYNALSKKLP